MSKADSASLILRLYELRREPTLRAEHNVVYAKMQPFLPELRKRRYLAVKAEAQ